MSMTTGAWKANFTKGVSRLKHTLVALLVASQPRGPGQSVEP